MKDAQPQQKYQVRFDWGLAGFQALAAQVDVVIVADALPSVPADAKPVPDADPVPEADADDDELGQATRLAAQNVIAASFNNRTAVAEWVLARQAEKGDRFSIAVIAVGERRLNGTPRFAVEDFLVAGAVIDSLSSLGIDHCSPEAAAASAAFVGLKQALRHLVGASETGHALAAQGRQGEVRAASRMDNSTEVAPLEEVSFPA